MAKTLRLAQKGLCRVRCTIGTNNSYGTAATAVKNSKLILVHMSSIFQ